MRSTQVFPAGIDEVAIRGGTQLEMLFGERDSSLSFLLVDVKGGGFQELQECKECKERQERALHRMGQNKYFIYLGAVITSLRYHHLQI